MAKRFSMGNSDAGSVEHLLHVGRPLDASPPGTVILNGDRVRALRGTLTLAEFARKVGIALDAARNAEQWRPVRLATWQALAGLGVPPESLLAQAHGSGSKDLELPSDARLRETIPPVPADGVLHTAEAIEDLAERCGLFNPPRTNAHLTYTTGDISYWLEQAEELRSASVLWAEFLARGLLLASSHRTFPTQGDLSHAARPLVRALIERASEIWPAQR